MSFRLEFNGPMARQVNCRFEPYGLQFKAVEGCPMYRNWHSPA